jgi:biotin transporter BioY
MSKAFWVMLAFVPGDLLKALIAALIATRVRNLNLT